MDGLCLFKNVLNIQNKGWLWMIIKSVQENISFYLEIDSIGEWLAGVAWNKEPLKNQTWSKVCQLVIWLFTGKLISNLLLTFLMVNVLAEIFSTLTALAKPVPNIWVPVMIEHNVKSLNVFLTKVNFFKKMGRVLNVLNTRGKI